MPDRVGLWNTSDMDFVLTEGDKIYKELEAKSFLSVDDLPQIIVIENNEIAIGKLRFDRGYPNSIYRKIIESIISLWLQ